MKKTITINYNAIRKIAIISCVVCLAAFILLINVYGETTVFEYLGDFLVSIKFLPKWLSVIVLLLGIIVRIADFIVITFLTPSVDNGFRPYNKKFKAINIAGLGTLPLWFWALVFYGFHFSKSKRFGIPFEQWEELSFVIFLIVIASIICLLIAYLDIVALTIPLNVSEDKIVESTFNKNVTIDFSPIFVFYKKHHKKLKISLVVVVAMCIGIRFMPATFDSFFYFGDDFETALIEKNEENILEEWTDYATYDYETKEYVNTRIDYEATGDTIVYGTYDTIEIMLVEVDVDTGKTYTFYMTGKRKWLMTYEWELDISSPYIISG